VKRAIADGTDDVIGIFEANEAGSREGVRDHQQARPARRGDGEERREGARSRSDVRERDTLQRLWGALQTIEQFGVSVSAVTGWTRIVGAGLTPEQRFAVARDLKEAIKARFEPEAWQRVPSPSSTSCESTSATRCRAM
jgi:hypothetical protein